VAFQDLPAACLDYLCLVVKKTCRSNGLLDLSNLSIGIVPGCPETLEDTSGALIDLGIGALRRGPGGNEQIKGYCKAMRGSCVRVFL